MRVAQGLNSGYINLSFRDLSLSGNSRIETELWGSLSKGRLSVWKEGKNLARACL